MFHRSSPQHRDGFIRATLVGTVVAISLLGSTMIVSASIISPGQANAETTIKAPSPTIKAPSPQPAPPHAGPSRPSPGRQIVPAFITSECNDANTVTAYVETTLGTSIYCFAGSGTLVNIDLPGVTRIRTSEQTDGIITYNYNGSQCESDGEGYGEDVLYLDPALDIPFPNGMRLCSVELT